MKKKKTSNDQIAEALDIEITEIKEEKDLIKSKVKEITVDQTDVEKDYASVRKNLRDLIDRGFDCVEGIMKVAEESEHPRAYEVAATMLKTVVDANKDLLEMHKKIKDLEASGPTSVTNNQTNAIYVGSSSELLDIINPKRVENVNKKRQLPREQ